MTLLYSNWATTVAQDGDICLKSSEQEIFLMKKFRRHFNVFKGKREKYFCKSSNTQPCVGKTRTEGKQ